MFFNLIFSLIIEMFSEVYTLIIEYDFYSYTPFLKEILLQYFKYIADCDTSKMSKIMVSVCSRFNQ